MTPDPETVAYIGLGGNLDNPLARLRAAHAAIAATPGIRQTALSRYYRSAPLGPPGQPDYVNAVMAVATTLPPHALLDALQAIENAQGRVRGLRWGPRTVDLDILLYGDLRIADERLTVPHPGLAEREFVLYPLADIAPPDLPIPGQANLPALLAACPRRGLEEISDG